MFCSAPNNLHFNKKSGHQLISQPSCSLWEQMICSSRAACRQRTKCLFFRFWQMVPLWDYSWHMMSSKFVFTWIFKKAENNYPELVLIPRKCIMWHHNVTESLVNSELIVNWDAFPLYIWRDLLFPISQYFLQLSISANGSHVVLLQPKSQFFFF